MPKYIFLKNEPFFIISLYTKFNNTIFRKIKIINMKIKREKSNNNVLVYVNLLYR